MSDNLVAPTEPFKMNGKIWIHGWDIPLKFVVDAENICWINDAHGGPLEPCNSETLIAEAENDSEKLANEIRTVLGLENPVPSWMKQALAHGWTPPKIIK